MKRSRSGCRACRARKIKCDEGRPTCKTCSRRGVNCSYEVNYQWIMQDDFNQSFSTKYSPKTKLAKPSKKLAYKPRRGPFSRHRQIGQEVVCASLFGAEASANLETVMEETPFMADEEVITQSDCPNSLDQFKKFRIYKKGQTSDDYRSASHSSQYRGQNGETSENTTHFGLSSHNDSDHSHLSKRPHTSILDDAPNAAPPRDIPIHVHSPLHQPFTVGSSNGNMNRTSITSSGSNRMSTVASELHGVSSDSTGSYFLPSPQVPVDSQPATNVPLSQIFFEAPIASPRPQQFSPSMSDSLSVLTEQDFFDHFVNVTADELVPITYEENPFLSSLPELAKDNTVIWESSVAYGASHKCMLIHGSDPDPLDDQLVHQLINRCVTRLDSLRKSENVSQQALLSATSLAMIEVDRGNATAWRYFMNQALNIMRTRSTFSAWELSSEVNSMTFRLIGYMSGIGNMSNTGDHELLSFPSWPQWSGSLDYLTGVDLNLLPLFSEAANLIKQVKETERDDFRTRSRIYFVALKIVQRMNDYWLDEYWPDSEITAMCIMFQESSQIHVSRRVLEFPMTHPVVQRLVHLAMDHLDKWIPPASTMQRCMTFILATLASESLVAEHRTTLLIRLKHMALAGFAYNWKICDDIRKHWDSNTSLITAKDTTLIV